VNQSIEQQLIIPGNLLALILNFYPTGENQRITWTFFLALSKKYWGT